MQNVFSYCFFCFASSMVFVWQFTAAMYYRLASCGRQKDVMPITALRDSKPLLAVTCVITSWSCDCAITLWSWDCANPFKQLILVVHSGCTLSDMLCVSDMCTSYRSLLFRVGTFIFQFHKIQNFLNCSFCICRCYSYKLIYSSISQLGIYRNPSITIHFA